MRSLAGWLAGVLFFYLFIDLFYHISCNQIHYQPRSHAFISAAVGKFNLGDRNSESVFDLIIDLGVATEMKILYIFRRWIFGDKSKIFKRKSAQQERSAFAARCTVREAIYKRRVNKRCKKCSGKATHAESSNARE
jgi:hypothetical protein